MLRRSLLHGLYSPRHVPRFLSTSTGTGTWDQGQARAQDQSITIGDVTVPSAPCGSGRLDLVPKLIHVHDNHDMPPCHLAHLRWMLQKDLALHQDFLLLGPPELASDRRYLISLYASLLDREVEYMSLSRDTSDADLKQRKEVLNMNMKMSGSDGGVDVHGNGSGSGNGNGTHYVNQAPVRAALNGRLLFLDGLEKVERNVLPTLNNLLENRELSLDDGSMLVSSKIYDMHSSEVDGTCTPASGSSSGSGSGLKIHRVHPDFRVVGSLSVGGSGSDSGSLDPPLRSRFQARQVKPISVSSMLDEANAISKGLLDTATLKDLVQSAAEFPNCSLHSLHHAVNYVNKFDNSISPRKVLGANGVGISSTGDIDLVGVGVEDVMSTLKLNSKFSASTTHTNHATSLSDFVETETTNIVSDLVIAGFESGRRAVALVGPKGCYKSAMAREMAKGRGENIELFSLYPDMMARDLLMMRGTDIKSGNTVWRNSPLMRAVEQGTWVILDGIDKLRTDALTSLAMLMEQGWIDLPNGKRVHAGEGFHCIALAHPQSDKEQWITPEIAAMFSWVKADPLPNDELAKVLMRLYPSLDRNVLRTVVDLRDQLDLAIGEGAADSSDETESLLLTFRKIKHICRRIEENGSAQISQVVHNTMMTDFMPDRERRIVIACMLRSGIRDSKEELKSQEGGSSLDGELLERCRRIPSNLLLVPNPQFEENPGHSKVMGDILEAHSVGEKALLITGYQGVGKNRVVDFLLSKLHCEREYFQLHRDTTVQSLLSTPSVENGRIVFHDSPLVRAAKNGQILVLDEADKAPVEVVALLKGLIEDGELALPDGTILHYDNRAKSNCIKIHPDFRIWALANPAVYPFHGNNLAREMADVFSCHNVPPMDVESHERILRSYGPSVPSDTINRLVLLWEELRKAHGNGEIVYPYSVRESVNVVKHLNSYPRDGIESAIQNIVSFDQLDLGLEKQLDEIFSKYGISISSHDMSTLFADGSQRSAANDRLSTPKTRASNPKYGQVDPDNVPHIGGNNWAGGTGGSDTAGLGGRGGYMRLDANHPVHQVSDEMKAEVSDEARRRAKQMAEEALNEKLRELDMGKLDWERYDNLRNRVDIQIQQLRNHLKDLQRRNEERIWLKRQTSGELDDSRLVDALSGERDVFKRRGHSDEAKRDSSSNHSHPISIKLIVDISASMYRFNGHDSRLERLLEASLMIMEGLRGDQRFELEIIGHNGSSAKIPLISPDTVSDLDEATQLKVLECMVANTQYCYAGDNTINAIASAVDEAKKGDLVLIISDANLKRYRIIPKDLDILQNRSVHAHLILIGSFGDEAKDLASTIPNERAHVCFSTSELPLILKNLITGSFYNH